MLKSKKYNSGGDYFECECQIYSRKHDKLEEWNKVKLLMHSLLSMFLSFQVSNISIFVALTFSNCLAIKYLFDKNILNKLRKTAHPVFLDKDQGH